MVSTRPIRAAGASAISSCADETDLSGSPWSVGETDLSDEELAELALAADLSEPLSDDAVPWQPFLGLGGSLPSWYMPAVTVRRARGWRIPVVVLLVASFVLVDAFGLCFTYGQVVAA